VKELGNRGVFDEDEDEDEDEGIDFETGDADGHLGNGKQRLETIEDDENADDLEDLKSSKDNCDSSPKTASEAEVHRCRELAPDKSYLGRLTVGSITKEEKRARTNSDARGRDCGHSTLKGQPQKGAGLFAGGLPKLKKKGAWIEEAELLSRETNAGGGSPLRPVSEKRKSFVEDFEEEFVTREEFDKDQSEGIDFEESNAHESQEKGKQRAATIVDDEKVGDDLEDFKKSKEDEEKCSTEYRWVKCPKYPRQFPRQFDLPEHLRAHEKSDKYNSKSKKQHGENDEEGEDDSNYRNSKNVEVSKNGKSEPKLPDEQHADFYSESSSSSLGSESDSEPLSNTIPNPLNSQTSKDDSKLKAPPTTQQLLEITVNGVKQANDERVARHEEGIEEAVKKGDEDCAAISRRSIDLIENGKQSQ